MTKTIYNDDVIAATYRFLGGGVVEHTPHTPVEEHPVTGNITPDQASKLMFEVFKK